MSQGKVEICGVNTAKLPLLKAEEKEALFARIRQGDSQAREEYIKYLAYKLIQNIATDGVELY